jgi:hypothetical protein
MKVKVSRELLKHHTDLPSKYCSIFAAQKEVVIVGSRSV